MYSKSQQFQKKNSCKTIINFSSLNLSSSSQFKSFPSISIIIVNWNSLIRHYGLQLVISHTANPDNNALRHVSFKSIGIHKATHWPYRHILAYNKGIWTGASVAIKCQVFKKKNQFHINSTKSFNNKFNKI